MESQARASSPASLSFWTASSGLIVLPLFFCIFSKSTGSLPRWAGLFPFSLAAACFSWLYIVSAVVPEPYLDEVFHIPQAQKYCQGRFQEWDDKITTPPGLYLISLLIPGVVRPDKSLGGYVCDASSLRAANAVVLMILAYLAFHCRHEIEARLFEAHSSIKLRLYSQYALHTAFNIALFPLLFFFSGLYYTDVASTAAVLVAYLNHLRRLGRDESSILSDLLTIIFGVLTLFFRQTNVFWVVVYMGGLEAVHAIKTLRPERVDQPYMSTLTEQIKYYIWRYSVGDIHDPPLHMLWPDDMAFCVLSLGIAALCNPIRVIRQIWPYIAVLAAFGSFVVWNGGVVLGDKSNHVATIHLPQMLYIWPFFAFFSLPLLIPYAFPIVNILNRMLKIVKQPSSAATTTTGSFQGSKSRKGGQRSSRNNAPTGSAANASRPTPPALSTPLKTIAALFDSKIVLWPVYLFATVLLSLIVVRYNTIIHPFTLADNRHYMFYVFRYTIRRTSWIRYALVVPYTFARWMTWGTMAGCSQWLFFGYEDACSAYYTEWEKAPFLSYPFWINRGVSARQTDTPFPTPISNTPTEAEISEQKKAMEEDPLLASVEQASTSTGLIFLLATTLSLMTAPLVEPRYFIIPWVMWRLLVPAWRVHDHEGPFGVVRILSQHPRLSPFVRAFQRYDLRLVLETAWFIAINAATGYIFLTKPYVWRAEDGTLLDEGRLQRFMW